MDDRWTTDEMLSLARQAVIKADGGPRGLERVTHEEIAAMAAVLWAFWSAAAVKKGEST